MTASFEAPLYILKSPTQVRSFKIFLSSGSDLTSQRDLFDRLIGAVNDAFRLSRWEEFDGFRLEIDRWEHDAGRRTDGSPNAEFVRRAIGSHFTLVLLHEDLRVGTKQELEGVVQSRSTQLGVIWMKPQRKPRTKAFRELDDFLNSQKDIFLYNLSGPPASEDVYVSMTRIIARLLADATIPAQRRDPFYEDR